MSTLNLDQEELVNRVTSVKNKAIATMLIKEARDSGHTFDLDKMDTGSRRLMMYARGKYPWADSDLEALLAYIKDEDNTLEKDIGSLKGHDTIHDNEIDSVETELDHEGKEVDQLETRLTNIEDKLKEITARIFSGVERP